MKTHRIPTLSLRAALPALALLTAFVLPTSGLAQAVRPVPPAPADSAKKDKDIVELSPFTVTTDKDTGYFAENTLAGSRLNTNLADIAASITVVTKQQMEDTAALDINDVFKYEASTEGSSTYTPSIVDRGTVKDTVAGYTFGNDGTTTNNAQSNRIRGLNAPDAALNNYSTNNRIPFDAYNVQSLEITRGPNSLLFGLGTPSGVVNSNTAQATLNRDTNTISLRVDHNGSYRSALALNRSIIKDQLAVYGAYLYDNRQFSRKPSRDLYRRGYGAITFKPFQNTIIKGFAEGYQNDANRPNFLSPRDQVTPWLQSGRPVYDPVNRTITLLDTNRVIGPIVSDVNSPGYVATVGGVTMPANTSAFTNLTVTSGGAAVTNPWYIPGIVPDDTGRPLRRIDNGASIDFFARQPQFYAPAQTSPATATPTAATLGWAPQDPRYAIRDRIWTASANLPSPTASIGGRTYTYGSWQWSGITNKSIYDWTKYNTLQANFGKQKATNYNLEIEQRLAHNLHFTAGWLRQDIDESTNYTINQLQGATIGIDTNQRMINGAANPYFGLPFIYEGAGGGLDTFELPETDDNYRAMLAYDLDFSKNRGWTRWLGRHRLLGLWQEQDAYRRVERWRMNFVSGDADATLRYISNLAVPGTQQALSTATMRHYYLASPGSPQAQVNHSTGFYGNQGINGPYTSQVQVWNYNTGQFQNDSLTEQLLYSPAGTGQGATQREVKGTQLTLQSYLWDERLVTTFGWRHDNYRARITTTGPITRIDGTVAEPALPNDKLFLSNSTGIVNRDLFLKRFNRWDKLSGSTKTLGGAFRPFKGTEFGKSAGLAGEFVRNLSLYYNKSDNFNPPATFQTDYFNKPLPKPTGDGKDYGVGVSLFNNKLVARVNWYETNNLNERTAAAGTLLNRLIYSDTTTGLPWASAVQRIRNGIAAGRTLQQIVAVNNWNSDAVNPVNDEANQRKIYDLIKLPYRYYDGLSSGGTQDSKAKGVEVQITYNPLPNWTMKLTGSKDQATYRNIAPQYDAWLAVRLPNWEAAAAPEIPDFTDPNTGRRWSLSKFWTGYGYTGVAQIENTDGNTSAQAYHNNVVVSQVALAKALEGAISPMQRQYRGSFLTNYNFREGRLKGFGAGGSARWASKAAIGFYGKVGDPRNSPTVINLNDVTRPIYDKGDFQSDLWISYSRKILGDRIGWKVQLNINNWTEGGRLMPTQVNFDGTPWAYRIIDPRQFILTSTFTF
ncbi:MAG: TonB-dependent receptor plug domain-containing protein [Verrucomicrobia bacterium]|nr:TonB-dependent receptor plug domain-containing protein [Verrucomicrobiota bacterium]